MRRTNIFVALACALLAISLSGCGATNHLQSITLNVSAINGTPVTGAGGIVSLEGNGGTLQLQPMGNYGGGQPKDLTKMATFTVIVDPFTNSDGNGGTLLTPCFGPCPTPFDGIHGTVEWDATGLVTAVEPAECTWVNGDPSGTQPAWAYVGAYMATATYAGVTSQPVYIPVASAAGVVSASNPSGACGPTTTP
ncbi:MAG: hypothetical protein WAU58_16965 [Terriglobales bacterium]